jgi:hypothetical protein
VFLFVSDYTNEYLDLVSEHCVTVFGTYVGMPVSEHQEQVEGGSKAGVCNKSVWTIFIMHVEF